MATWKKVLLNDGSVNNFLSADGSSYAKTLKQDTHDMLTKLSEADFLDGSAYWETGFIRHVSTRSGGQESTNANHYIGIDTTSYFPASGGTINGSVTLSGAGSHLTVGGNIEVTGNLTVSGDTTTLNVATLSVEDAIITAGSGSISTTNMVRGLEIGTLGSDSQIAQFTYNHPTTNLNGLGWTLKPSAKSGDSTTIALSGSSNQQVAKEVLLVATMKVVASGNAGDEGNLGTFFFSNGELFIKSANTTAGA